MSEDKKEMPRSGDWEEKGSCPAHRTRSLTNARRRQAIVERSASDTQIPLVESQRREMSRPGTSGAQGPGRRSLIFWHGQLSADSTSTSISTLTSTLTPSDASATSVMDDSMGQPLPMGPAIGVREQGPSQSSIPIHIPGSSTSSLLTVINEMEQMAITEERRKNPPRRARKRLGEPLPMEPRIVKRKKGRPRFSTPLHTPGSSTSSLLTVINEMEQMAITGERRKNPPRGAQKRLGEPLPMEPRIVKRKKGRPRFSTPLHTPGSSTSSLLTVINEMEQMAITEERRKNPPRGAQKRKTDDPNPSHMDKKPKGQ